MKKVAVVITNRAHFGRLKSVLKSISDSSLLELQLIVGGSALLDKYGAVVKEIEKDFKVDYKIWCHVDGDRPSNMADTTAMLIQKLTAIWENDKPDMVLAHADRYEQLAVAIAASYMNIPLAHTQGGEDTGSIDDKVRNAITQLADIHFASTEKAAKNVASKVKGSVHFSGCPSIDGISTDLEVDNERFKSMYRGVGASIDYSRDYFVVMYHPDTRYYDHLGREVSELVQAVDALDTQTIWLWSNPDAGSDEISGVLRKAREAGKLNKVCFVKNFEPKDFYALLNGCKCLIGNTSSGIREGSYLGVPYVCIGTRQENREHSDNVVFVAPDCDKILKAVGDRKSYIKKSSDLYGYGNAGMVVRYRIEEWSSPCIIY